MNRFLRCGLGSRSLCEGLCVELKAVADATHVLQGTTGKAESLKSVSQGISASGLQSTTDLNGSTCPQEGLTADFIDTLQDKSSSSEAGVAKHCSKQKTPKPHRAGRREFGASIGAWCSVNTAVENGRHACNAMRADERESLCRLHVIADLEDSRSNIQSSPAALFCLFGQDTLLGFCNLLLRPHC